MDEAAFQTAIAGCTEARDVSARQVNGGFVLNGNRRWVNDMGNPTVAMGAECIATDASNAASRIAAFLANGAF